MPPIIGISANVSPVDDPKRQFSPGVPVHYIQDSYCQFVLRGGGIPIVLTPGDFLQDLSSIVERLDGLVLTGGVDIDPGLYGESKHPSTQGCNLSRDRFEIALLHEARRQGRAVLGICRGIQLINVAFGGSLYQDIPSQIDGALPHHQWEDNKECYHPILLTRYSPLTEIFKCEELRVNSSHHQAVKELGRGLVPLAAASDGVIEALHCPGDRFTIAVQWHPERMLNDPLQIELAKWFIRQAG